MPYICEDCPNKEEFKRYAKGSQSIGVEQYLDSEGDVADEGDYDYGDMELDDFEELTCNECDSVSCASVDEDEWEAWEGPSSADERGFHGQWREYLKKRRV